jgi:predicted dehydrogenase
MPLGIGLIGAGWYGTRYIHHLLHDLPGVSLAALCRKRIGEGLPSLTTTEIPVYGDYRALIADPTVEAVVVVTPPSLCLEICLEAVQARKPILSLSSNSTCNTTGPEGLRWCQAQELLHTRECGRP